MLLGLPLSMVLLGGLAGWGQLPKAIISAEPIPVKQAILGEMIEEKVRGSILSLS